MTTCDFCSAETETALFCVPPGIAEGIHPRGGTDWWTCADCADRLFDRGHYIALTSKVVSLVQARTGERVPHEVIVGFAEIYRDIRDNVLPECPVSEEIPVEQLAG
ncbi:MAG: hypothetical protein AB7Q01_08545 [Gammaproteobacteria bacterium]